ncbi:hypothetical protein HPB50_013369 [Hyalomma asiaticum]|uniref:Uncharacterized protein n=1 Tax=Hyalomma asiaticum TaxID=266040 RepID=A0ACB7RND7_HYAAI|nr:hypothetical protein HPB50_013369 [Hyalomma asiaticum]
MLVTPRNPTVLLTKRMGNTTNVIILFDGHHVRNYARYGRALLKRYVPEPGQQCMLRLRDGKPTAEARARHGVPSVWLRPPYGGADGSEPDERKKQCTTKGKPNAKTGRLETATGTSEAGRIRIGSIEIQTQGQQYRVSPNTGRRRLREPKGNDRRQRHRGTLTGKLGGYRGAR